jgi:hypothetical protein
VLHPALAVVKSLLDASARRPPHVWGRDLVNACASFLFFGVDSQ